MIKLCIIVAILAYNLLTICFAQTSVVPTGSQDENTMATQALLDSVGPRQRHAINSVYLVLCGGSHGSGFITSSGLLVTNAHVIEGCAAAEVIGRSAKGKEVRFVKAEVDQSRDLALLLPSEKLSGGLDLGDDKTVIVGKSVTTWGFPIIYTSGAPLLTVGYVSGFNTIGDKFRVKHIVVNGAFNPGNSGGPVFMADDDKVVGIVVWRNRLTSNNVPVVINGLKHSKTMAAGTFSKTLPNGQVVGVSNEEAVASVLDEFYNLVQVQIGEAIAVSELKAFIKEKESDVK